jgi:hypothetical protein
LPRTVPTPWRITKTIGWICSESFGRFGDSNYFIDAHLAVLRGEDFTEESGVHRDARFLSSTMEFVEERLSHHWSGIHLSVIESKLTTGWVTRTDVREDRIANASHVRRLGEVISSSTRPDEDIVSEVLDDVVSLLLRRGQAPSEQSNVLRSRQDSRETRDERGEEARKRSEERREERREEEGRRRGGRRGGRRKLPDLMVPSVSISNGCSVANPCDLIAIVPPSHDSRIFRSGVSEPPVGLTIVVHHDHRAISQTSLEHEGGMGEVRGHLKGVAIESRDLNRGEIDDNHSSSKTKILNHRQGVDFIELLF